MFKNFLALLLVLLAFTTVSVQVFAQETPPIFTPFCFKSVRCDQPGAGCLGGGVAVHRARLTVEPGKGPQPNSKVYVITCLSSTEGQRCTSGNAAIDNLLTYPPMPADLKYQFEALFGADGKTPINQTLTHTLTSNGSGDLSVSALEWQDHSVTRERKFLGMSEETPQPTTDAGLGLGAQQQAEIPKLDWVTALKSCLPLVWDPDGRVFDSQSLEPIPGASVTLTKKRANGIFSFVNKFDPNDVPTGILTNPYLVNEDGGFSFFVPDGTYKLLPKISSHAFPSKLTLNSNYSKIYSNIYPSQTGVEIIEKGGPQHRDIPVDSVSKPAYFPIKIMEYNYQSDRISSVFIDGKVSHPLATINVYSVIPDPNNPVAKIRHNLIETTKADKSGRFSIIVDQSTFDKSKSEMFGEIEAVKADFGLSLSDTNSTPAILKLNPILTYIEGNASYKNQVLPGAKIELLLNGSIKPYYETVADSQGHFKITSDYIPFMPYQLRYSTDGTVISTVTTAKFLADNSSTINDSSKINLFYPQYSNPKINENIKKSIASYNDKFNNNGQTGKDSTKTNDSIASKNLTFIGIVLLITILLIGAGILGVYLIKKSQSTSTI